VGEEISDSCAVSELEKVLVTAALNLNLSYQILHTMETGSLCLMREVQAG